jgi:cell division protein FtsB
VLLGAATVLALTASLFVIPLRDYYDQDVQIEARSGQLAEISAVVADLRSEVERLRTDDGVRDAARAELGFVQDGEQRLTVIDPELVPTDLPEGWPYDLVENIVDLRRNPVP